MNSQESSLKQELRLEENEKKDNGKNGLSETEAIVEILSEMEKINTRILVRIKYIMRTLNKNNVENLLGGKAGIDYDTLLGHIIIRDGEGGGYIMKEENEGISEENPDGGYYIFDEAQNVAPEGYHIPCSEEWKGLYELGIKLGLWGEDNGKMFSYKLKLPFSGRRSRSDGSVYNQGSYGSYWSSSPNGTNARTLSFNSSNVLPQYNNYRAYGFSVRCFKNYY